MNIQSFDFFQSLLFKIDIVVIGDGIYTDDLDRLKVVQQPFHQIAADETCGTCDQDGLAVQIYIIL